MKSCEQARRRVEEGRPFVPLASKHAVLEVDFLNRGRLDKDGDKGNQPEEAVPRIFNRPGDVVLE